MSGFSPQVWVREVHPCCRVAARGPFSLLHGSPSCECLSVLPLTDSGLPFGAVVSGAAVSVPVRACRGICAHAPAPYITGRE